jgi:hypothetical protein
MKVYVTSLPGERLDTMAFHLAKRMFFDACGYDVFTHLSVPCCCGRPDWNEVFMEASKKHDAKKRASIEKGSSDGKRSLARARISTPFFHARAAASFWTQRLHPTPSPPPAEIGVFFCGPPSMEKDLAANIESINSSGKSKARFNLMAEKF